MLRHCNGQQSDVNCLNQSKNTQSWCETKGPTKLTQCPVHKCDSKVRVLKRFMVGEFQYQPCLNISYTTDEALEGSSCYELLLESVHTHAILV